MSKVLNLSYRDFNEQGQLKNYKNKIVLIKFYTTWCGYCQRDKPIYDTLANFYSRDKKVIIVQFECDDTEKNKKNVDCLDHLNKFSKGPKINGYPTIVLFKNNLYVENFKENRSVEEYVNFINKYY
jgi:thiol-disulfide isomerase/thioredoxin